MKLFFLVLFWLNGLIQPMTNAQVLCYKEKYLQVIMLVGMLSELGYCAEVLGLEMFNILDRLNELGGIIDLFFFLITLVLYKDMFWIR